MSTAGGPENTVRGEREVFKFPMTRDKESREGCADMTIQLSITLEGPWNL